MLNFALKALITDEMSLKSNKVAIPNGAKIEMKPKISHRTEKAQNSDKELFAVHMELACEAEEGRPQPYDLKIHLVGYFETTPLETEEDKKAFSYGTLSIILPYLRSAATALTTSAGYPPLFLPIIPIANLFPKQPDDKQYVIKFDESLLS